MKDLNCLAVLGLAGWHVEGRCQFGTFTRGPLDAPPGDCPAIDMSDVYLNASDPVGLIWRRPNLSLSLPDDNVRNLFEGCIGSPGTTDGHPWDGRLESLESTDSVGLNVYVAVLKAQGGKVLP